MARAKEARNLMQVPRVLKPTSEQMSGGATAERPVIVFWSIRIQKRSCAAVAAPAKVDARAGKERNRVCVGTRANQ